MEQNESILNIPIIKYKICLPCIVCGESAELTKEEEVRLDYGRHVGSKVCDKCKAAILYMRDQMPQDQEQES